MKKRYLLVCLFIMALPIAGFTQGATWTWMNGYMGSNISHAYGSHRAQGVADPTNIPPQLYEAVHWTDKNGNFWLFGGVGPSVGVTATQFADLWKFDITTNMWTWVKGPGTSDPSAVYGTMGVPSPLTNPGGTGWGAIGWTDTAGDLWLFGGYGENYYGELGYLNTLWRYNIATNEWTFMNGNMYNFENPVYGTLNVPGNLNTPGSRGETNAGWADENNNLWLFAGNADPQDFDHYNDMWRYNIGINQWAWAKGPQYGQNNPASYGTLNVPASSNLPPARDCYTRWVDGNGNFYIYGGKGPDVVYNDIWRFNPVTETWTWIAGDSTNSEPAKYGTYCTPGNTNVNSPGGRSENRSTPVAGCASTFITYGGFSYGSSGMIQTTYANSDLWAFNAQTLQWNWLSGADTGNSPGFYGIKNQPSPYNLPPARSGPCLWTDRNNNLWMFGGMDGAANKFNDMWKCTIDPACIGTPLNSGLSAIVSKNYVCSGDSSFVTFTGGTNLHITPSSSVIWIDSLHAWFKPRETTTYLVTGSSGCNAHDSLWITIALKRPGIVTYTLSSPDVCRGGTVSLNLFGENNVHISPMSSVTMGDSSLYYLHPDTTTGYYITSLSTCGWRDTSVVTVQVQQYQPITISLADSVACSNAMVELTINGLTGTNIFAPNYGTNYFRDSVHAELQAPGLYIVTGSTSCQSRYIDTVIVKAIARQVNYTLSSNIICKGDSALFTLAKAAGFIIKPATNISFKDSTHLYLFPDSDRTYIVYQPSVCGGIDSSIITIHVITPGVVNYTLSPPLVCANGYTIIDLWGVSNPGPGFFDSVGPYHYQIAVTAYPAPYSLLVTGHSYCGVPDTVHITYPTLPSPSYSITKQYLCKGDTAHLSFTGLQNPVITPSTGVTWIDSAHVVFKPDTTTNYVLSATTCQGQANYPLPIQVGSRSSLDYTVVPPYVCYNSSTILTVTHATNVSISPAVTLTVTGDSTTTARLTPAGTTTYTIIGTSTCGFIDTSTFTVRQFSSASIYSVPTICQGDTDYFTIRGGYDFSVSPAYNISWIDSSLDSSHLAMFPDTTTNYTISGFECSGYRLYDNFILHVDTPHRLNYTVSPNLCAGTPTNLNIYGVKNLNILPAPTSVTWTDSVDAVAVVSPDTATTYTIISTSVCGLPDTTHITLRAYPKPAVNLSSNVICAGDTALLTTISFNYPLISPITDVYWIDSTHAWLHPSVTTTYYIYSDVCGGTNYVVDSIILNVQPAAQIHVALTDTSICTGGHDTLTISGASSFALYPSSSFDSTGANTFTTVLSPTANTSYTLVSTAGCATDTTRFNIYVGSGSPAYTLSGSAICKGDSVLFNLSNGTGGTISPATGVVWLNTNTASLHPDSTTEYHITAQSTCVGPYTDSFNVAVYHPTVQITSTADKICPGDTATICASPTFPHYAWNNGYNTQCIKTTAQGNYYVTVTDQHNCTANSNQVTVSFYPVVQASIITSGDTLTSSTTGTYQWYSNGNIINGATGRSYIFKAGGSYTVQVIDSNGCSSMSNPFVVTQIQDIAGDGIKIYPNPLLSGNWHLTVYQQLIGAKMELYDESGQLLKKGIIEQPDSEIEIIAAGGVYYLRIESLNNCVVKKLIKL